MDQEVRRLVRERAENRCEYCLLHQDFYELSFHIEHIVAQQHLEDDSPANLALACDRCNFHKGTNLSSIDYKTGEIVELYNPRVDVWDDHFDFVGPEIVGTSESGRATSRLLCMNSERRLLLRRQLIEEGIELR